MTIFDSLKYMVTEDMTWADIMKTIPLKFRVALYRDKRFIRGDRHVISEECVMRNKDLLRKIIKEYDTTDKDETNEFI